MKYTYPAIFSEREESGLRVVTVSFPDLDIELTGFGYSDCYNYASRVLAEKLIEMEENNIPFPKPSDPMYLDVEPEDATLFISVNLKKYKK